MIIIVIVKLIHILSVCVIYIYRAIYIFYVNYKENKSV